MTDDHLLLSRCTKMKCNQILIKIFYRHLVITMIINMSVCVCVVFAVDFFFTKLISSLPIDRPLTMHGKKEEKFTIDRSIDRCLKSQVIDQSKKIKEKCRVDRFYSYQKQVYYLIDQRYIIIQCLKNFFWPPFFRYIHP